MSNIQGRRYTAINNLVRDIPDLGGPEIVSGSLSLSISWESHPTGSISIEGIPDREIGKYRSFYSKLGRQFSIYGFDVVIDSYAETKSVIEGRGIEEPISTYDLGINLSGYNQEKVTCPIFIRTKSKYNNVSIAGTVSLSSLARRGRIRYSGYNHTLEVPSDAGNGYTMSFESSLRENLRVNRKFIDYSTRVVRARNWTSGNTYNFTRNEILGSVESSKQKPVFYKRTQLQGKDGILEKSKTSVDKKKRKSLFNDDPLVLKPPVTRTLEEGDVAVQGIPQDTKAEFMPSDVKTLQSMDLNFDLSGPRKTLRQTTTVNNKVMKEVVKQYGFAYSMLEAFNPAFAGPNPAEDVPKFLVRDPQQYWRQIEEQTTSYIYKPVNGDMELEAEDTVTKEKFKVRYLDETGKSVETSFSKRYLTQVVTQGWKLGRFKTEAENTDTDSLVLKDELENSDLEEIDITYYKLQQEAIAFRKLPLKSIKSYLLVDPQEYYDKTEEIPFETQRVKRKDLGILNRPEDELIIATPSKDYVYPMMVMAETSQTHSFSTMPNPDNIYIREERRAIQEDPNLTTEQKIEDLRLEKLVAELTTGEDSFSVVKRTILPSKNTTKRISKNKRIEDDVYVEYSYGASNQDQNFKNSLQNIKFTETFGRPGGAEVFPDVYVRRSELTDNREKEIENTKNVVYYLNSSGSNIGCSSEGSVSANTSILSKALATARLELVLNNFLSTSEENMQLAFLHPYIRPGDYINSVDSFTKRRKRVKSVSFQLNYNGYVEGIGKHVTCDGTSVSLGIFDLSLASKVSLTKEFESNKDGLKISSNININEKNLGGAPLLINLKSRRNR